MPKQRHSGGTVSWKNERKFKTFERQTQLTKALEFHKLDPYLLVRARQLDNLQPDWEDIVEKRLRLNDSFSEDCNGLPCIHRNKKRRLDILPLSCVLCCI